MDDLHTLIPKEFYVSLCLRSGDDVTIDCAMDYRILWRKHMKHDI